MQESVRPASAGEGEPVSGDSARGFLFALGAYLLWGVMPLYMKLVAHIPALEVVAHRVVWSLPVAGVLLLFLRRTADVSAALRSPRVLAMAALTAAIIAANWGVYVWAIATGRTLEAALGYYINPLVTVALGTLLLGEAITRPQIVAVGLAALAVMVLTVETGTAPWASLFLAVSFAVYGYLRKTLPIGPSQGFFLEVLILFPPALAFILWLWATGSGHFSGAWSDLFLLLLAGPVVAVPLILYAFGAKLLRLSTIGIMQYIGPTLTAIIGVFVFGEPFGPGQMVAFTLIWIALAIYTWSMFRERRGQDDV